MIVLNFDDIIRSYSHLGIYSVVDGNTLHFNLHHFRPDCSCC